MRVSFTVELSGPERGKRMCNWIGAYRLATLAVILILALVEAGLSTSTPAYRWCYSNSTYRSCSVPVGLSGERKYTLGIAITTSLFSVAGISSYVGSHPWTPPLWLELVFAIIFAILWVVSGILCSKNYETKSAGTVGLVIFSFVVLHAAVLVLKALYFIGMGEKPWRRPVHKEREAKIRLEGDDFDRVSVESTTPLPSQPPPHPMPEPLSQPKPQVENMA